MPKHNLRPRVIIRVNELVIQLQDELRGIERSRAVGVHDQMRNRLTREKTWRASQLVEPLQASVPVELLEKEEDSGIHRIGNLAGIAQQAFITGKLTIGKVKGGRAGFLKQ